MSENEGQKIPNFHLRSDASVGNLGVYLGNNLVTGPLLVGDKIKLEDGRVLVVTERTWLDGHQREANLLVTVTLAK
ncbi:hypothetical protein ACCQ08_25015 [Comamonas sp. SY3]|uniref:hypothetical protein n=1 Tax=Comamonas sp. SY3 TaxID=3243601 RepID=UPI0035938662